MNSEDNKKPTNPKREMLIQLSQQADELRKHNISNAETEQEAEFWQMCTINYILLHYIYNTEGATEFNTFNQWKERSATIKKGVKAFVIWGQPIKASKTGEQTEPTSKQAPEGEDQLAIKYKYWPMCYLFSDKQVVLPDERIAEAPTIEQEATEEETAEPIDLDFII